MKATELIVIDESKVFIKLITTALLENRLDSYQFKAESIYTAQTAKEALELLDLHPRVDLIILDATIAALNPNDLLDSLTDPQSCSLIEVILTTTKGKMPKLTNQTKKHILGIIEKPFTMEVFLQKVQDFFQLKEQEKVQEMLLEKEVKLQFQRALKIIGKYLKDESINYDETELKTLCRQYFCGDSTIEKDEFISLISIIIHEFYELKSI
ncbi:MAG: response regulator, partial [Thiovulaceae bacterium]|nr:response regulator [Sulfurimonadaceae bacterium]